MNTTVLVDIEKGTFRIKVQDPFLVLTIKRNNKEYTFYKEEQGYYAIYNLVKEE